MTRQPVRTDHAPAAIGPYSQAIVANGFVFVAGQTPMIPGTRQLVDGGIQAQTRQALQNIKAILEAAGSSMDRVVKTTVFLQHFSHFTAMNEVYGEFFPTNPPARSTVEVARLPLDCLVEIEAIALID
jgi:2-iminobutanoate/2-iminopropanoate deaminase